MVRESSGVRRERHFPRDPGGAIQSIEEVIHIENLGWYSWHECHATLFHGLKAMAIQSIRTGNYMLDWSFVFMA